MALLKHGEIENTRNTINTLSKLDSKITDIITKKSGYEETVRSNYKTLQEQAAINLLEAMDIEKVNTDKDGIRVATLKKAGITNVAQALNSTHAKLCQIEGIGDATAEKILTNAKLLQQAAAKNVPVALSTEKPLTEMNAIISSLHVLIQFDRPFSQATELHNSYHDAIATNITAAKAKTGSFKWLFSSKKNKDTAVNAEECLTGILNSGYPEDAEAIINEYTELTKNNRMSIPGGQVRIISAPGMKSPAFDAFNANSAPFYAMLERVMGEAMSSAKTAGDNALPEELLESIENYGLDLHLLKANLRRYQTFGTQYILHQERVLLGDEMGLGKTMQAIAAFCHLKATGGTHFLVVCPLSVVVNWQREIWAQSELKTIEVYGEGRDEEMLEWANEGGVAITTYETLNKIPVPEGTAIDMMVVDEAHYVKNPEALRTKSVLAAADKARRILFMSGTPLENRVEEMQFLIGCLRPDIENEIKNMKQLKDAEKFREAIAPVYLRRVREDVLKELPELLEKEQWGIMNKDELNAYKDALRTDNFMQIRQVSWQLDDMEKSTKAARLMEICEEAKLDGRKLIIFSFFKDVLYKAAGLLGENCIGVIDGSVSSPERQKMIDALQTAPAGSALVSQIQAGGVGLNIQSASVVIFCEPQIKPSLETQAISRAYRMGQSKSVMVHRLLLEKSVDERIMEMLHTKTELFEHFAEDSVIGDMDLQVNENNVMKQIVEEEKKRLGI